MSQPGLPARLLIAGCGRDAAKYAVTHWHYSNRMPVGKLVSLGVWEDERFIGAVVFGRGASPTLGQKYGLAQDQVCELVRVALTDHRSPVTQIVARALRIVSEQSPGLRAVVSFADPAFGHLGTIYQAGNWIYTGRSGSTVERYYAGRWWHERSARRTGYNTFPRFARLTQEEREALPSREVPGKFRYVYPLDRAMRRRLEPLRLPYPLAEEVSAVRRQSSTLEGRVQSPSSAL